LSMASLFAGHDSGPLHIAGAFGVPVLGVFAPGEPERTFPQGVGPWKMIAEPSPADVTDSRMVEQLMTLAPLRARPS
jgi:ADP-heptose:LPS heptosyltransferase